MNKNSISKLNRTLIFESGYTGHRSEYISHLMRFINSREYLHGRYIFLLNEQINSFLGELSSSKHYLIKFTKFEKKYSNSIKRSFGEWQLVSEIIKELHNINEMIFMDIDPYLILLIFNRFKKYNLPAKGILFQPYIHFKEAGGGIPFFIKKVFKNYLLQKYSVLLNSNITKLFILNDKESVSILNANIKNIFYNLPDPIEPTESEVKITKLNTVNNIVKKYAIEVGKKNLLVFGSIDSRKNLINIIDALRLLPIDIKRDIHLVIAGKFDNNVREKYLEYIQKYKDEISIVYNDGFVNAEEREPLFEKCDLILMPYINFYSASSVLGHTIIHNKNVVVSDKGLIGRIVKEHKIGIAVNTSSPASIKSGIYELLVNNKSYQYNSKALINLYSPENFCKTILLN